MTRAEQIIDALDAARENTESALRAVRGLEIAELNVRDTASRHLAIALRVLNTLKATISIESTTRRCK